MSSVPMLCSVCPSLVIHCRAVHRHGHLHLQATGTIRLAWPSMKKTLKQQAYIAVLLGSALAGRPHDSFCTDDASPGSCTCYNVPLT